MVILGMVQLFLDLWIITWSILGSPQNLHVIFCRFYGYFPFIAKKIPKGLFPYVLPIQWGWWPCHTNFSYSTLTLAIQLVAIQGLWDDRKDDGNCRSKNPTSIGQISWGCSDLHRGRVGYIQTRVSCSRFNFAKVKLLLVIANNANSPKKKPLFLDGTYLF